MERKKKVFIYAYDKVNLGDDLFVQTLVTRYPQAQFYIRTDPVNRGTFRELQNLRVLDPSSNIGRWLGKIRPSFAARYEARWENRCNAMVYIGGSVFMEYPTSPQFVDWLKYQARRHPFFVLGANFGPYRTEEYRQGLDGAFRMMEDVCFRDQYSCRMFSENDQVRIAPDMLLACPMPEVPVTPRQIFVSVIDTQGRDGCCCDYVGNMARILQGYLDDGCTLVLASFCRAEGDENGIRKIIAQMNVREDSRIRILCYDGTNREEMMKTLVSSEYVIASRFHGTILAMAAGRPVLPVIYSDKLTHVLEDLNFPGVCFDLRQEETWDYQRSRENWDNPPAPISASIRQKATEHFAKFDEFMKN